MRLIDADALMKALGITDMSCWACDWGCRGWCTRSRDFSEACAAIEDAHTIDAVPVVRCKNCKNLFSCYKWPTEDILNNFCQDGEFGENGYETY